MKEHHINWSVIIIGILLVGLYVYVLSLHPNQINITSPANRFDSTINNQNNAQQLPNTEVASEAQWDATYLLPQQTPLIRSTFALTLLLVFGILGFITNLFFRIIYLYCEWRDGNEIDWKRQMFLTFAVPAAYILVMIELMVILR